MQEVSPADNPDEPVAANHGNPLDTMLLENLGNLSERGIVIDRDDPARHYVCGVLAVNLNVLARLLFRQDE